MRTLKELRLMRAMLFIFLALGGLWCASFFSEAHGEAFIMPVSLRIIEEAAFEGTSETVVRLPEGILIVEEYAFANSPKLRHVYMPDGFERIEHTAFFGNGDMTIIGNRGGKAEDYAKAHHFRFMTLDFILPETIKPGKSLNNYPFYAISHWLILMMYCLHALLIGRRQLVWNPMSRRERINLRALDWCFP